MDFGAVFNRQVDDLLAQLLKVFPDDEQINSAKLKIQMLNKLSKTKLLELFTAHVMSHKDEIIMKNESYFLDDTERLVEDKKEFDINNLADLKHKWTVMTNEQKDVVWQYFGILVKVSEKYVASLLG